MITQLREHIKAALNEVNTQNAPRIFALIQTSSGYKKIEDQIIHMMIDERMRASACIIHIEQMI